MLVGSIHADDYNIPPDNPGMKVGSNHYSNHRTRTPLGNLSFVSTSDHHFHHTSLAHHNNPCWTNEHIRREVNQNTNNMVEYHYQYKNPTLLLSCVLPHACVEPPYN